MSSLCWTWLQLASCCVRIVLRLFPSFLLNCSVIGSAKLTVTTNSHQCSPSHGFLVEEVSCKAVSRVNLQGDAVFPPASAHFHFPQALTSATNGMKQFPFNKPSPNGFCCEYIWLPIVFPEMERKGTPERLESIGIAWRDVLPLLESSANR